MRERGGVWIAHGAGNADRDRRRRAAIGRGAARRAGVPAAAAVADAEQECTATTRASANSALWPLCHQAHVRPVFHGRGLGGVSGRQPPVRRRGGRRSAAGLRRSSSTTTTWRWSAGCCASGGRCCARRSSGTSRGRTSIGCASARGGASCSRACWATTCSRFSCRAISGTSSRRPSRSSARRCRARRSIFGDRHRPRRRDSDRRRLRSHRVDPERRRPAGARWSGSRPSSVSTARSSASASIGSTTRRAFPSASRAIERVLDRPAGSRAGVSCSCRLACRRAATCPAYAEISGGDRASSSRASTREHGRGRPTGRSATSSRSLPLPELVALYRLARFCIVSSLHDGMNLVAKEFVAGARRPRWRADPERAGRRGAGAGRGADHQSVRRARLRRGDRAGDRHAVVGAPAADAGAAAAGGRARRAGVGVGHPRSAGAAERTGLPLWVDTTPRSGAHVRRTRIAVAAEVASPAGGAPPAAAHRLRRHARRELAPTPAEAVLAGRRARQLDRVAASWSTTVGVVSGRRLADVAGARRARGRVRRRPARPRDRRAAGARSIITRSTTVAPVIASISGDGRARHWRWCPGRAARGQDLRAHLSRAARAARSAPSCALEEFEAIAEPQLEARVLKLLIGGAGARAAAGRRLAQGPAAEWIRARVARASNGPVSVVYLGDDRTDEDAFDVLDDDDVAIGVGDRPHTHLIDCRLAGPDGRGEFFRAPGAARGTKER